jgi:hypothetical protein
MVEIIIWLVEAFVQNRRDKAKRERRPDEGRREHTSDIDKFLEEVERLRNRASKPRQETDEVELIDEPTPAPPPPAPTPVRRPVPRAKPVRPRPTLADRLEVVPEVVPVEPDRPDAQLPPSVIPVTPPLQPAQRSAPIAPKGLPTKKNATRLRVAELMSADNLRAAMILREILDPPLSRRRR